MAPDPPVALVYVARGEASFAPTAAAIAQVVAWTASPHRFRFAVLAGSRCLTEQSRLRQLLHPSVRVDVINATDAALHQRLRSDAARHWFAHTSSIGGKTHTYTVPKLFLFELLPDDFDMVVTLDNDVVALADLAHLADEIERLSRSLPHAALFYASEQQNKYRWTLNWTRASWPWPTHRNGINGGVGVQLLDRLRSNADAYRTMMQKVLDELDDVVIGGRLERTALNGLGDQTAFSAAAVVAPATWARLFRHLPCEWNWQTCVWSYGRVNECPLHEGRLNTTALTVAGYELAQNCSQQPVLHDGSCHRRPKLLHFDCPGDLKGLLVSSFVRGDAANGVSHTEFTEGLTPAKKAGGDPAADANRTIAVLQAALRSPRADSMCRRADLRLIGSPARRGVASATFCNASFLLSRLSERAQFGVASRSSSSRSSGDRHRGSGFGDALPAAAVSYSDSTLASRRLAEWVARAGAERHDAAWCGDESLAPRNLPRVYVYGHELGELTINPFGFPLDAIGTTAASGPTYVNAVHARLLAAAVPDPKEADLFFIPESAANDTQRCDSLAARLDSYWKRRALGVGAVPNYFRRKGGRDHFTASHFRASLLTCSAWQSVAFQHVRKLVGVLQSPWFREDSVLPIPERRLSTRPFACKPWMASCPWLPNSSRADTDAAAAHQHVFEVPYGGSVHGSVQWRTKRERPLLAVAAFNSRGHRNFHGQMDLRRRLLAQCERANGGAAASVVRIPRLGSGTSLSTIDSEVRLATLMAASQERQASRSEGALDGGSQVVRKGGASDATSVSAAGCRVVPFQGRYTLANVDDPQGNGMLLATLEGYRTAIFSLQPAGDDPARKGIIDSVTCGCIPVLFHSQQRQLWPQHWGGWVADATVLLPGEAVLNGSLNVLDALRAIPRRRISRMQQVLRQNAHRLHYGLVGSSDAAGDALEISLAHLMRSLRAEEGANLGAGRAPHTKMSKDPALPPARCSHHGSHRGPGLRRGHG